MKRTARIVALLACCLQLSLFAAPRWPATPVVEEPREARIGLDGPKEERVIIEFSAPPLLEARKSGIATNAAAESLDALTAKLAADLDRIEGDVARASARVATNGGLKPAPHSLGRQYKLTFAGASARVSAKALPAIRALSYVRAVYEDTRFEAHLSSSVPVIRAPQAREKHDTRGRGVVVAIIDTGIDYRHWALGKGFGPGFKVVGGYDFANNDSDPIDDYGHGTHVAGIVAGTTAPVLGVAPEATLLAYKVLAADGSGSLSDIIAGVERAIDPNNDGDPSDRADVVNMSLGGPLEWDDPLVRAVERGIAAGAVFALSAGNRGRVGTLGSPAVAPSAITVGATDLSDVRADFTSRGPSGGTWQVKPEVSAPGVGIVSAVPDGGTLSASGTSMAAPHVAGLAALLLEKHPHWTPADVKAAMVSTAQPVWQKDTAFPAVVSAGSGRIDALRALEATIFPSTPAVSFGLVPFQSQPFTGSRTVKFTNRGTAEETLTVNPPPLFEGAKLTAVPKSVTLAPGETAEVTFTLDLAAGMQPNEEKVVFSGMVDLAGTKTSLHLPWLAVNGDVVSATYTGTDDFEMLISRGGSPAPAWPEGPRTRGAFAEKTLGVDVVVLSQSEAGEGRLIIRERERVKGNTVVTIKPEDASLQLRLDGVNEAGVPLSELREDGAVQAWHYIFLPSHIFLTVVYGEGARSLRISPLTETEIRTYETVLDDKDHYYAAYRNLRGIQQDESLRVTPADWASQKILTGCDGDCEVLVGGGAGGFHLWPFYTLPSGDHLWTLHITPQVEQRLDFRAHIIVREKGAVFGGVSNPWRYISPAIRNRDGRVSWAPFNRMSSADYVAPHRDTPVQFGDGPVVLRMNMGLRKIEIHPHGALGELYGDNAINIRAELKKADGSRVSLGAAEWLGYYMTNKDQGAYQLTVTDTYTVAGLPGKVTMTSLYDNRIYDAPPSLSMFRVENSLGMPASTVMARTSPRLVLGARTSMLDRATMYYPLHTAVPVSGTRVWWRRHGSKDEWVALPVTLIGEDNSAPQEMPGSPGTMFAAPLHTTASAEGPVDVKIVVTNEYGATSEVVYEPAYVIGPPVQGKRRATR
ncbi:MAG TPA: S8 family serine peptidase [Thermoanaerobaculia bacterium]|nr:S8 family serine peptidase [Thermoanaerobaculia bacterium]